MAIGDRLLGKKNGARSFAEERELLSDDLARMAGRVERVTVSALDAVGRRDTVLATELFRQRDAFGAMRDEIEDHMVRMIALWRPLSSDVSDLIGVLKVAAHLARIGELSCNVARRAVELNAAEPLVLIHSVERMGRHVLDLLHNALDAYARRDGAIAADACGRDDDVDDAYDSLFKELLAFIADDPGMSAPSTHMMLVAKDLERIGDRATDIAEIAYALAMGGDVARAERNQPGR